MVDPDRRHLHGGAQGLDGRLEVQQGFAGGADVVHQEIFFAFGHTFDQVGVIRCEYCNA